MPGFDIDLPNPNATEAFGARLAACCEPGLLIFLSGDLGAGKTTLVRGLLRALGHAGSVKSPTYTLIESYQLPQRRLHHFDLYRLADPGELEWLGLRDLLDGEAIALVEWPERGEGELPAPDVWLTLVYAGTGRRVQACASSPRGEAVLACARQ